MRIGEARELRWGKLETIKTSEGKRQKAVVSGKPLSAASMINWFWLLYRDLGFEGCSSHSGRRTAITRWSRNITAAGGSLRDVQALARHQSLQMIQKYIAISEDAMKRVVQ